jgi:hypothetical protein
VAKKLPKEVAVKWNLDDGESNAYLMADKSADVMWQDDEWVEVGIYKLDKIVRVRRETVVSK